MKINEVITPKDVIEDGGTKTLDAGQLRIKSRQDQKAQISQNVKRERARQKSVKAEQSVQKANASVIH